MPLTIALGTTSKDKYNILETFLEVEGVKSKIVPVEVKSGINKQPQTEKETITGAINRAQQARQFLKADWGVGMEGGLEPIDTLGFFLTCTVAIVDADDNLYLGTSGKLQLPTEVSKAVAQGKAFGETIRDFANKNDNEAAQDLANLLISRREAFIQALGNAFLFKRYRDAAKTK